MTYFANLYMLSHLLFSVGCATNRGDANIWLEEIESKRSLTWVEKQNIRSRNRFTKTPAFHNKLSKIIRLLQDTDKAPSVTIHGNHFYSLYQDVNAIRGRWVRTRIGSKFAPLKDWEIVLDIDMLSSTENKNWVFNEAKCLEPSARYCLIALSAGGSDRAVVREFDTKLKKFRNNGFFVPEGKSWFDWINQDHIALSADFGKDSLTTSGYGKFLKVISRNQPLSEAKISAEVPSDYLTVITQSFQTSDGIINVGTKYYSQLEASHLIVEKKRSRTLYLPSATVIEGFLKNHIVLSLRNEWRVGKNTYRTGDVVAAEVSSVTNPNSKNSVKVRLLYRAPGDSSVETVQVTKDYIGIGILKNVVGQVLYVNLDGKVKYLKSGKKSEKILSSSISDSHYKSNKLIVRTESFLTPPKLKLVDLKTRKSKTLFSAKSKFLQTDMVALQKWAVSKDGTKIPYFVVGSKKHLKSGNAPLLIKGYGGFEYSQLPTYDPILGSVWLEKGGLFALANIRGGGEFGPGWHAQAIKEKRQNAYDDFFAVAENAISQNLTRPKKIGIYGGSNGGLLMGVSMTQRPDLYGAVISRVPLLDMMRYHKLLAGAAWIGEYGDPDNPRERAYIANYSPYQNLKKHVKYPPTFLFTSTKDDRVHPGHARKFANRLFKYGNQDTFYFENTEGGHKGASNVRNEAEWLALSYQFLWDYIGDESR